MKQRLMRTNHSISIIAILFVVILLPEFSRAVLMEDGVLFLDEYTFDEELAKHKYLLVEFYAPWW